MNPIKKSAISTKNFVSKHRVAIAVTVTSIVWLKAFSKSNEQLGEFLKEHNLYEEYYTPEESYV